MADDRLLETPTCDMLCIPCDQGQHELCDNKDVCHCTHLTWLDFKRLKGMPVWTASRDDAS